MFIEFPHTGRFTKHLPVYNPRSGSTWLMEMLSNQPKMISCNEPFDLRNYFNHRILKTNDWNDLYTYPGSLELCINHLKGFERGHFLYGYKNPAQFEKNYSPFSNRIVFKILHACEDNIYLIQNRFNSKIIILLRHPIPVSLSRKELPQLKTFFTTDFK